ncbi:MAG: ABC transporter substrate-binding protein [Rhodospirillales bacterium]
MHKRPFIFGLILLISLAISGTARADCGIDRPVVFAGLNWDSNRLHSRVARFILEQGFGCATDMIPGATLPLVLALIRGDADVMMELWEEDIQDTWNQAEADGKVIKAGINYPAALQGWFIPRYLAEGAAIEAAFKRRKPILFYYWGPTWIMGKHDMVMLQEPPFDPDVWRALRSDETPAKACAYPRPEVEVALNKDFAGKAPALARFFAQYRTSMDMTSAVLSFMRETDASADEGARHFLKTQQTLWRNWVPEDVAGRVLAALD